MNKPIASPRLSAQTGLKRHGDKRADAKFIGAARANQNAKVLPLFDLKVPIVPSADGKTAQLRWLSQQDVQAIAKPPEFVYLGEEEGGAPVFATNFTPLQMV